MLTQETQQPFVPSRELAKIRSLSCAERTLPQKEKTRLRRERIARFREELTDQKLGIAQTIAQLQRAVEKNPDIGKDELLKMVNEAQANFRLSKSQVKLFEFGIDEYLRRHALVEEMWRKYRLGRPAGVTSEEELNAWLRREKELFAFCFGKEPAGGVSVDKRPMALVFTCDHFADFVHALNVYKTRGDATRLTRYHYADAESCRGVAIRMNPVRRTTDNVLIVFKKSYDRNNLLHEEQHHWNSIFKPPNSELSFRNIIDRIVREKGSSGSNPKQRLMLAVTKHLRRSTGFDRDLRDEIICQYVQGFSLSMIECFAAVYGRDFLSPDNSACGNGGSDLIDWRIKHDYKGELAAMLLSGIFEGEIDGLDIPSPAEFSHEEISQAIQEVFFVQCSRDVKRWLAAIEILEKKGYGRQEIIQLLYIEPVEHWQKLARRMPAKQEADQAESIAQVAVATSA